MADISKIKTPDGVVYNLRDDRFSEYLKNFEESSDNAPYLYRPAGEGIEDIGDYESLDKIIGGTICWNQFAAMNRAESSVYGFTFSITNGMLSIHGQGTYQGQFRVTTTNKLIPKNHIVYMTGASSLENYDIRLQGYLGNYVSNVNGIVKIVNDETVADVVIRINSQGMLAEFSETHPYMIIDLTQMFGSTIADYIYSLETATPGAGVAWFKKLFPKDYYEYNAGELMSVQATSHEMVGFNVWDEEWEEGTFNTTTGANLAVTKQIRSKNIIKILPNTTYYWKSPVYNWTILYDVDGNIIPTPDISDSGSDARSGNSFSIVANHTFTTPANAYGMRFYTGTYTTPYKNNIALNLVHDGTHNGEYEPYKKNSYPLDSTLTLRGIPKLDSNNELYYDGDEYLPDGTVTRRYGIVDLGTLTWIYSASSDTKPIQRFNASLLPAAASDVSTNLVMALLYKPDDSPVKGRAIDKSICTFNGNVYICDTSYTDAAAFKAAMSGVMLVYELATPTTETADPYQQVQQIDSWGTEEFTDAGVAAETRDVAIPVGHETRYLAKSNYFPEFNNSGNGTYAIKQAGDQMSLSPITLQQIQPLATHTYTNVIATANSNQGGGFFYLKVRGDTYNTKWYIKTRVLATVPGQELYETDTTFELWGYANTYSGYACMNKIKTTSYRPIYYNSYFRVSETGYNNNCGGWIGFNLIYATNQTNTSYKRNIVVELLDYQNCEVELQDDLITPDNIPERATHTNWYSSTNTSYENFDAYTQGLRQSGDSNTTSISNLYYYNGNYIADSPLYRYQLLFHVDDDRLTPLNNDNNVTGITKTMLTDVEFNPFKDIFYYYSTTTVNKDAGIAATALFYSMSGIDLRYSFNITTSAFTIHKDVYLVVTPTTNNKVKLASADPLTQELPTSDDGYWYLLLGRTYNAYCISLHPKHPIYAYKDGKIVTINPSNVYFNDIEMMKPLFKKVDSTNIIHIEDAAEKPLKECKIDIQPVQDLHGYDNPWPAGGGKNLYDASTYPTITKNGITCTNNGDGSFTLNGTASTDSFFDIFAPQFRESQGGTPLPNGAYRITGCPTGGSSSTYFMYITPSYTGDYGNGNTNNDTTVSGGSIYIKNGYTCNNLVFKPMIRVANNSDDTFAPFSNICPITGWDSVKVNRTGKNLWNPTITNKSNSNYKIGGIIASGNPKPDGSLFLAPGTYTVSISEVMSGIYVKDEDGINIATNYARDSLTFSVSKAQACSIMLYKAGVNIDYWDEITVQLELGSTATEYEPYQGQTYDITFPTGAGTVYGGMLDVMNGVLVVDRCFVENTNVQGRSESNDGYFWYTTTATIKIPPISDVNEKLICDRFRTVDNTNNGSPEGVISFFKNGIIRWKEQDTMTLTEYREYLASNPFQICYELATPITYTLTPQEITTLLGTNNIWADAGNISCTYYVNSQLNTELNNYIPKSLGTAKGDIIYYSDNNTPNRLGIGSQGQVLKVNSNGIPAWDTDNSNSNTTYTFAGGTNQFTVTPSDGTAQTINITPQVPNASTSTAGIVQLNTATNSTSTTQAATPSAVKAAYDLALAAGSTYGECATTGNTAAKLVTITNFELTTGVSVHIKFSYANTATTPTLNISNTGAKTIIWNKECASPWSANEIITLTYDGTYWVVNNCNKIPVVRLI